MACEITEISCVEHRWVILDWSVTQHSQTMRENLLDVDSYCFLPFTIKIIGLSGSYQPVITASPMQNRDFAMHFVQMCYMLCIEVAVQWAHAGCGLQRQKKIYWQLWHLASKWNGKGKARGKLLRGICDPLALTNHQKYPLKHVWTERIKASLFLLLSLYKYIFFFSKAESCTYTNTQACTHKHTYFPSLSTPFISPT